MAFEHAKSSGNVCPRVVPPADGTEEPPLAATATPMTRVAAHAAAAVQRTVRRLFRVGREDALFRGASPCPNSSADSGTATASPMSENARRSRLSSSSVGRVIVDHLVSLSCVRKAPTAACSRLAQRQQLSVVGRQAGESGGYCESKGSLLVLLLRGGLSRPAGGEARLQTAVPFPPSGCRSAATREATTPLHADGLRTAARPGPACCSSSFSRTSCTPSSRWSQGNASQGQDRPHARNVNVVARPIASFCGIGGSGHRRRRTLSGTGRGRPLMNRPL